MKRQRKPRVWGYQTDDVATRVEVCLEGETVWLNQNQMADFFLDTWQNIGQFTRNAFDEGEPALESVVKDFFITAANSQPCRGKRYNLHVILSAGFHVSAKCLFFPPWAPS